MGEERFKVLFSFVFPFMAIYFCPSSIVLGRVINSEEGFTYKEWVNWIINMPNSINTGSLWQERRFPRANTIVRTLNCGQGLEETSKSQSSVAANWIRALSPVIYVTAILQSFPFSLGKAQKQNIDLKNQILLELSCCKIPTLEVSS